MTDETCQNYTNLNDCLGSDVIENCINLETFNKANGFQFTFNPDAGYLNEGSSWLEHRKVLSMACAWEENGKLFVTFFSSPKLSILAHKEAGECWMKVTREGPHCGKVSDCDSLSTVMTCKKQALDSLCTASGADSIKKCFTTAFCSHFGNCDYCKN